MKQIHSQQLVGLQKLTLQDICPQWFDKLTGKTEGANLNITDDEKCIAGEANGFKVSSCGECYEQSLKLVGVATSYSEIPATQKQLNNDERIQDFVAHWNEFHVE